jgi:arginyl-tRNA synthetase
LKKNNLLTEDKGAKLVYFPDDKYPPLMIIKQDGATLYATRDLATDKFRLSHYGENIKVINEVGIEQSLYFKQLYELEKMLGWFKGGQRIHVGHGHFRFKEGKMSTRKGNVIWLEDVLEEAEKRAGALAEKEGHDEKQKDVRQIAVGALKWNDLKRNYIQDVTFDWDDVLNMQGNSCPYLQYTYARTQSILSKASVILKQNAKESQDGSFTHVQDDSEPEELLLLRKLIHFPEVVEEAADRLAPSTVCTYLFELAQEFNLFYQKVQILSQGKRNESFFFLSHLQQVK